MALSAETFSAAVVMICWRTGVLMTRLVICSRNYSLVMLSSSLRSCIVVYADVLVREAGVSLVSGPTLLPPAPVLFCQI